jgi:hypothetical protein
MLHHIPKENAQSSDHHAQQRNPTDQKLAKRHLSRRASCLGQDGEVGAAMRADFCRLIDLFIALGAGVHSLARKLSRSLPLTIGEEAGRHFWRAHHRI